MNLFIFTHALSKTPLQVFIITIPGRRNLPIFHKERFLKIYFLQQKGEHYGAEKMTKIKLAGVLVTGFDKFHHFCNLYITGSCFAVS